MSVEAWLRAGIRSGAISCRALANSTPEESAWFARACALTRQAGQGHMANCMLSWAVDMIYLLER